MKTHYDVLNLDKKCSSQDIKNSFINLSKKYHPDKNKDLDAHKKFLQINEAYSVLGKPESRRIYDQNMSFHESHIRYHDDAFGRGNVQRVTPYEYMRAKYKNEYYQHSQSTGTGALFTGKKLAIALCCCLMIAFGSILEISAAKKRRNYQSEIASLILLRTQERAKRLGNKTVKEMLVNGSLEPIKFSDVAKEYEAAKKK